MRQAARATEIAKTVTPTSCATPSPHTCFADGADIRTVQELLGHSDVSTTMTYIHVLNRPSVAVGSPLDR